MKNKRIFNTLFVVAAVATGVGLSLKPWQILTEQRELANKNISEMTAAEANRTKLIEQKVRLESSTGREEIARRQGYLKPGEQLLDQP